MGGLGEVVVHDDADGAVGAKVEDIPLWLGVQGALVLLVEQSMSVITTEGNVVDCPDECCAVVGDVEVELLGGNWTLGFSGDGA